MESFLAKFVLIVAIIGNSQGSSILIRKQPALCAKWTPYKDEKCLKIVEEAGHQTQEDAEIICDALSEELNREDFPKLITIKTQRDQDFFHNFLFNQSKVFDNVWLGLKEKGNTGVFEWNDGEELIFNNWANQSVTDDEHKCVQMESGKGVYPAGKWVKVHCEKKTTVVCERIQTWTLATLQSMFLNNKLEQEKKEEEWNRKVSKLETEIEILNQYPGIPLNFIYVQLPDQAPPSTLWPKATWKDISAVYAGLFFRVLGGQAAAFGEIQDANATHLLRIEWTRTGTYRNPLRIPPNGIWSDVMYTAGETGLNNYLRFLMSGGEIRPRNQAVKIWQRVPSN